MLYMDRIQKLAGKIRTEVTEGKRRPLYDLFEESFWASWTGLQIQSLMCGRWTGFAQRNQDWIHHRIHRRMMTIVVPKAKEAGYEPDAWFSPDSVGNAGRPYPYMIFKNMEALKIRNAGRVMKVGDTVSDIKEGKNAGVFTVGVVEGSSEMGLTQAEYEALTEEERDAQCRRTEEIFQAAGADYIIRNMEALPKLIEDLSK